MTSWRPEGRIYAVEDGFGGVVCTDGAGVAAQLVEHFGKTPHIWPTRADADREGRSAFGRPKVVEVDDRGRALR